MPDASLDGGVTAGTEPGGSLLEEADAMLARVMEVDEAGGTGAEEAAEVKVSTDIPKLERLEYRPSLCSFKSDRVVDPETRRQTIHENLAIFDWKVPLEQIIDEVLGDAAAFAWSFDEIPLGGHLRSKGEELSLCPYCFRTLVPGQGLHFLVDLVLDEWTYSPTAAVSEMRWKWQPYWIRNRREPTDWREFRAYLRYIRRTVGEIVRETDPKEEFPKLWVEKYRASVWRELPRQYT